MTRTSPVFPTDGAGRDDGGTLRGTLYLLSAAALGQAIQLRDGLYQTWAFPWLALAMLAAALALLLPHARMNSAPIRFLSAIMIAATLLWPAWALVRSFSPDAYWAEQRIGGWFFGITTVIALAAGAVYARRKRPLADDLRRALPWLLGVIVGYQLLQLATYRVGSEWAHVHGYRAGARFYGCLVAVWAAVLLMLPRRRLLTRVAFIIAIGAFAIMGDWIIRWQKPPYMDVWFNQTYAIERFIDGNNPYGVGRYPLIFDDYDAIPPGSGPHAAVEFETLGFAYTPWSFWLELIAHRWAGDLRYAMLACMILTAALIAFARPGSLGPLVALVYLFTPRAFFMIESAWTEPTVTFPLALLVFVAMRWPKLVPAVLGIFLVSKQYLVFAIAPALLLLGGFKWRTARALLIAAAVGAVISLPLILWDFPALLHGRWHDLAMNVRAFMHCNFGVVSQTEMGNDLPLSFMGWVRSNWGITLPTRLPFLLAAAATPLLLWRSPRTAAGFAAAVGTVYLIFFASAHLVRCNYYYFILACFVTAAAATLSRVAVAEARDR